MTVYDVLSSSLPGWLLAFAVIGLILLFVAVSWWLTRLEGKRGRRIARQAEVDQWNAAGREVARRKSHERILTEVLHEEANGYELSDDGLDAWADCWNRRQP